VPDQQLSRTQRKKRERLLSEIRAEVQARLAEKLSAGGTLVRPPRYDEVFAKGIERQGKLEVGDDVWKSETRRGPEAP
jgi:GTP cyclohydrolase III